MALALLPTAARTGGGSGDDVGWLLVACVAPLSYAASNVYAGQHATPGQSFITEAAGANATAAVVLIIIYAVISAIAGQSTPEPSLVGVIAGGSAIAYNLAASLLYFRVSSDGAAVDIGLASYVMTVVGVILSAVFLSSSISIKRVLAIAGTVAGVARARATRR